MTLPDKRSLFVVATMILIPLVCAEAEATLEVYDNSNQYLGELIDIEGPTIFVPDQGIIAAVDAESGGIRRGQFLFTSTDCSGQTYVDAVRMYVVRTKINGTLFVGDDVPPTQVAGSSIQTVDGCIGYSWDRMVAPASEIPIDSFPFAIPVTLPLSFRLQTSSPHQASLPVLSPIGIAFLVLALTISSIWIIRRRM